MFPSHDLWGWELPVYYDATSDVYRVFNMPTFGTTYTVEELPEDGDAEIVLEAPWYHANDTFTLLAEVVVR